MEARPRQCWVHMLTPARAPVRVPQDLDRSQMTVRDLPPKTAHDRAPEALTRGLVRAPESLGGDQARRR